MVRRPNRAANGTASRSSDLARDAESAVTATAWSPRAWWAMNARNALSAPPEKATSAESMEPSRRGRAASLSRLARSAT